MSTSTTKPTDPGLTGAPLDAPTVCEAFQRLATQKPSRPALQSRDGSFVLTWSELACRVRRLAAGLAGLGIGPRDTVAMLLPNVPECHMIDLAAIHLGAIPFTIYNSSTAAQIQHKLEIADSRILLTQEQFLPQVREAHADLPALEEVIVIDSWAGLEELEAAAPDDFDFEASWRAVDPEDPVTLIYTSGTTGPPKGAEWAHRTVMSQLRALAAALPMPDENIVSFLPMAHAGGRLTGHYFALPHGPAITCCPDMREIGQCLPEVHPDLFFAVPRVWEKLQVAIEGLMQAGMTAPEALGRVGLDRVKVAFVGGAPSAPELATFFRSVDVPLLEAYGCTEGSLSIFNRIEEFKLGTAGKPLPGVEIQVAADGELLQRGGLNFIGYRKQPDETAAALDADGWLHTGDIVTVDDEGFVKVVDRKKEIIINAAGKNMSPANIESAIKGASSLIGQVVTIGDGRRYNTALITLDPEAAPIYGRQLGLDVSSFEELAAAPEIHGVIRHAVAKGNERLSRVEQIKKFTLLPVAWGPDSDELTPTMKLKRKPIAAKYAAEIEALYSES